MADSRWHKIRAGRVHMWWILQRRILFILLFSHLLYERSPLEPVAKPNLPLLFTRTEHVNRTRWVLFASLQLRCILHGANKRYLHDSRVVPDQLVTSWSVQELLMVRRTSQRLMTLFRWRSDLARYCTTSEIVIFYGERLPGENPSCKQTLSPLVRGCFSNKFGLTRF